MAEVLFKKDLVEFSVLTFMYQFVCTVTLRYLRLQ